MQGMHCLGTALLRRLRALTLFVDRLAQPTREPARHYSKLLGFRRTESEGQFIGTSVINIITLYLRGFAL